MVVANRPVAEKVVLVIIDGIGDLTIPAFGDRTPLEVAHVPTLDAIAGVSLGLKKRVCFPGSGSMQGVRLPNPTCALITPTI